MRLAGINSFCPITGITFSGWDTCCIAHLQQKVQPTERWASSSSISSWFRCMCEGVTVSVVLYGLVRRQMLSNGWGRIDPRSPKRILSIFFQVVPWYLRWRHGRSPFGERLWLKWPWCIQATERVQRYTVFRFSPFILFIMVRYVMRPLSSWTSQYVSALVVMRVGMKIYPLHELWNKARSKTSWV
jgi:hypothetical protein